MSLITELIKPEPSELQNYKVDQSVICTKEVLKHLRGTHLKNYKTSFDNSPPFMFLPNAEYSSLEDRKKHLESILRNPNEEIWISESKIQLEIVKIKELKKLEYTDEQAEEKYLNTKPMTYLILSKPNIGETELAKMISENYKCLLITPEILLYEEISSDSRAGKCIKYNLKNGRAIGADVLIRLLEKRIQSKPAKHRGYVIAGFPLIPNQNFKEDPLSSESAYFNVQEIFDEIIDNQWSFETSTMKGSKLSVEEEFLVESESITTIKEKSCSVITSASCLCFASIENQTTLLFDIFKKPFVLIYILTENLDVINKISTYRFNLIAEKEIPNIYENSITEFTPDDILHLQDSEEIVFDYRNNIKMPIHFESSISSQLVEYKHNILPIINQNTIKHNPQYFIKIDGRLSPYKLFTSIAPKLKILGIIPAVIPELLVEKDVEVEAEYLQAQKDFSDLKEAYRQLRLKQITNKMFKWQLSNWGFRCPVALKNGIIKNGTAENAVQFMNRIFFLSDENAFFEFSSNPRPFLVPCLPKPMYKIFVVGPKLSGKTVIAKCLAYLFNLKYFDPYELEHNFKQRKNEEFLEKYKSAAIIDAIKTIQKRRDTEKDEKINFWIKSTLTLLKNEYSDISFYFEDKSISAVSILSDKTRDELTNELKLLPVPTDDLEKVKEFFEDPKKLLPYLPDDLKKPIKPVTVHDPHVIKYINTAIDNISLPDYEVTDEEMCEMYQQEIDYADNECLKKNGWIIDGFPPEHNILSCFKSDQMPNEFIFLNDYDLEKKIEKTKNKNYDFIEYQEFVDYLRKKIPDFKYEGSGEYFKSVCSMTNYENSITELLSNVEAFTEDLNNFSEKCDNLKDYLAPIIPFPVIDVKTGDKKISDILNDIILTIQNRFRQTAQIFSEEDKQEELKDFGRDMDEEYGEGEDTDYYFQENRRLGDTNIYCPIAFHKYFVLWKGKESYAAKFKDKLYFMSSENALNDFLTNAYDYILDNPAEKIPPMRIIILGAIGTGKTTFSKQLAAHFGLFYFNFDEQLLDYFHMDQTKKLEDYLDITQPKETAIIRRYLQGEGLPTYILNALIKPLWSEKPFKETGVVIDNFPKITEDVIYMLDNFLIPDAVIEITGNYQDISNRAISQRMDIWANDMEEKQRLHEEQLKRDIEKWEIEYDQRVDNLFQSRTEERRSQYLNSISPKPPQTSPFDSNTFIEDPIGELPEEIYSDAEEEELLSFNYDTDQNDQDLEELRDIILQELPKPASNVVWETYEEVSTKISNFIYATFNQNQIDINLIRNIFQDENIKVITVDNNKSIEMLLLRMIKLLEIYKFRNRSIFERVYTITLDTADKLLENGYYFLSKFQKACPVQIYENINPIHMYLTCEYNMNIYAMIHRRYIYYICGEKNLIKFKNDPLKYIENNNYQLPILPYKIAIIGPPKCGKTYIADKIQKELGLRVITRGQACRHVMRNLKFCELNKNMDKILRRGWSITEEMMANAVQSATLDGKCIAQGYILVGFPNSLREMKHLEELNIIPNVVIELTTDLTKIRENMADEFVKDKLAVYSYEFIRIRYNTYQREVKFLKNYLQHEYQNLIELSLPTSKWKQWDEVKNIIFEHAFDINNYFINNNISQSLPLKYLLVTPYEFNKKQGEYLHYCPCCLFYKNILVNGGCPPNRNGLIQYRNDYYWICNEHYNIFMKKNHIFLPPDIEILLPEDLPERSDKICYNMYEEGFCIVTYWDSQPRRVLIDGNTKYKVFYKGKCYIFCSEECLNKFMREPHMYYDRKINFENRKPLKLLPLPILGYLEQNVARLLSEVIMETERARPVHPGMDVALSAQIYIGILLKCRNPKNKPYVKHYLDCKKKYDDRREEIKKYMFISKLVFTHDSVKKSK